MVTIARYRTKEGAIKHFTEKMRVRYGFDLSENDIVNVIKSIQDGESEPERRLSNRESVHVVRVYGKNTNIGDDAEFVEVPVLYDTKLSCVVTAGDFLLKEDPEEWIWH